MKKRNKISEQIERGFSIAKKWKQESDKE